MMTYDFERRLRLGRLVREELGVDIDHPRLRTLRTPAGAVRVAPYEVRQRQPARMRQTIFIKGVK